MPRFVQPIQWRLTNTNLNQPGPLQISMRASVTVELEDRTGTWREVEVIVDSGASFPMMGTHLARSLNLPIPSITSALSLRTATGAVQEHVRDGEIHLRFPQLPIQSFLLKCVFRDGLSSGIPPVLGLHNTISLVSILFDGSSRPDAFMGSMTFVLSET